MNLVSELWEYNNTVYFGPGIDWALIGCIANLPNQSQGGLPS